MDSAIGIRGNDFAIVAADMRVMASSILVVKGNHDKFMEVKDRMVMSAIGDQGDAFRSLLSVAENAIYEELQNGIEMCPRTLAYMLQNKIHSKLRNKPLDISSIIAGRGSNGDYDLWSVDKYGAISSEMFSASGYAAYFVYGILDKEYTRDLVVENALEIVQKCINLLKERLSINLEGFLVKIVTNDGISSRIMMPEIKVE